MKAEKNMKIAILGSGQLAQLLTHAAYPLGIQTFCINTAEINQPENILKLIEDYDLVTIENENLDISLLSKISEHKTLYPSTNAIKISQDRLFEKTLFQSLDIPTPIFININSQEDLNNAIKTTGFPAVLKTRRFGYDGKGQVIIKNSEDLSSALEKISHAPAILESFINFEGEVSLISARNPSGEIIFYPLIKNTHEAGILRISESPYENKLLQALAEEYSQRILNYFNYVGVLAFEFFIQNNTLIANELAPRVHNSGHLTLEGFNVSQFETHLRAVFNLPLRLPILYTPTLMKNIIGTFPDLNSQDYKNAHVYHYGKTERPGRKLGHMVFMP